MSRKRRARRAQQIPPSEVIERAEKKLRQAEFFLGHLRECAVPGRSGERMEFYFSASLTAAQSAFYVLWGHNRANFESKHHRWRLTRSEDERTFLNRMVRLRDDDVHHGTLDAASLSTWVDAARVPEVKTFGPLGAFAEAQNPDGTVVRAPNALVGVPALYFKHAGKNVEASAAMQQFVTLLRDLVENFKQEAAAGLEKATGRDHGQPHQRVQGQAALSRAYHRQGEGVVERRLTAAAVNRPLALLRHLLRLAHEEWGELDVVPKIRTEKEPQGRLRWLTQEEATKVLSACKKSRNAALADLVEFSLFTGVRRGEALGLTWDRVDRARGVIRLELTKSGRRREVALSSNADAVLARRWTPEAKGYVFGSRNWNSFRSAWESALAAAVIEDLRFHGLRHTFASWLVQRGRTLREVQEALGHQTITMTMRYSHLAPDHLRAAVAVLDDVLPPLQLAESTKVSAQASAQELVPAGEVSRKFS